MRGKVWLRMTDHKYTVQNCPECQKGMAWDENLGQHIPRDEYDFKFWQGTSDDLMFQVMCCLERHWNPEVCESNIVRLLPMAVHECRMIKVMISKLETTPDVKVVIDDIRSYTIILNTWRKFINQAKKQFPNLQVVREIETP